MSAASSGKSSASHGIGILGALQVAFIVMKLAHVGDVDRWSWWMVFVPTWGAPVFLVAFVLVALAVWLVVEVFKECWKHLTSAKKG